MFAPEFRNVSVVFGFGFENVQLMLKKIAIGLSDVFFALKLVILLKKSMIESHSLSSVLRDLAQLGEVRGRKFSVVFVFGFEDEAGRGKVSVGVDFVDVVFSKASRIKVIGVLYKFLFSFLSFKLVEFEIGTSMVLPAFETVKLSNVAMEISL